MAEERAHPPVWQLVKEAAEDLGSSGQDMTYAAIKQHVWARHAGVNASTLTCQIIICSVNHPSRVHYPENKKPRPATGRYDFLYTVGRGRVVLFDPDKHGQWEIVERDGQLVIQQVAEATEDASATAEDEAQAGAFALEARLRDYLARNLPRLPDLGKLTLYVAPEGRDGVEFQTDVGPIDILVKTEQSDFCVFELKLGRGPDAALGQLQRYMGWVQHHLAKGKRVHGIIVAASMSDKIKYAATQAPNVRLMEYQLSMELRPCRLEVPAVTQAGS